MSLAMLGDKRKLGTERSGKAKLTHLHTKSQLMATVLYQKQHN